MLAHRLRLIIEGQRQAARHATPTRREPAQVEQHGELALHRQTARTLWRQQDVGLTMTEYKIVALLASHKGEVLTYRAIYDTAHYEGFVAGSGEHGLQHQRPLAAEAHPPEVPGGRSRLCRDREQAGRRLRLARARALTAHLEEGRLRKPE